MTPPPTPRTAAGRALLDMEWPINPATSPEARIQLQQRKHAAKAILAIEAEAASPSTGLRAALERLRAFVIEQGIRGGPPIEIVGRIAAEIDREQARAALASGEEGQ